MHLRTKWLLWYRNVWASVWITRYTTWCSDTAGSCYPTQLWLIFLSRPIRRIQEGLIYCTRFVILYVHEYVFYTRWWFTRWCLLTQLCLLTRLCLIYQKMHIWPRRTPRAFSGVLLDLYLLCYVKYFHNYVSVFSLTLINVLFTRPRLCPMMVLNQFSMATASYYNHSMKSWRCTTLAMAM